MIWIVVPTAFVETTVSRKFLGTMSKENLVPTITVGTLVLTMLVRTAVSTRVVGTATKEMFVSAIIVGTVVPTKSVAKVQLFGKNVQFS